MIAEFNVLFGQVQCSQYLAGICVFNWTFLQGWFSQWAVRCDVPVL